MGDLKLQGSSGLFGKEQPIQHRKLPAGVDAKQIQGMTKGNNLDEIVVADKLGERHVVYADELAVKDGKMPKVGDKVNLAFLDDEVEVIQVDDEINEDRAMAGMGVGFGLSGLAVTRLASGSASGNDTEIKRFSDKAEVSDKEMKWAKDVQDKSLKGKKPSEADQARFNDIMTRYAEQQKRDNVPYKPDSKVTHGELKQALKQAQKLDKLDQKLSKEEAKQYQETYTKLRKENPVKEVPQREIDWALKLEEKVQKQNYKPSKAEEDRYVTVFKGLQAQEDDTVMGLRPLDERLDIKELPGKGVDPSAKELGWAQLMQQRIELMGYKPTQDEMSRYENIQQRHQTASYQKTGAQDLPSLEEMVTDQDKFQAEMAAQEARELEKTLHGKIEGGPKTSAKDHTQAPPVLPPKPKKTE